MGENMAVLGMLVSLEYVGRASVFSGLLVSQLLVVLTVNKKGLEC